MTAPDEFDRFYADRRDRLLTLTYCLTGDLPSARASVRDAFVEAWHHWRKVGRLEDPEAWVRVRACAHAQRRHTARLWHREKGLDPEIKATLDALGRLPVAQRRVLLLTELTTASLAEIAREVGLPRPDAERELQVAAAQLAVARDVPTTSIRGALDRVAGPVRDEVVTHRWPRATIVRRTGSRRRRTHTVLGAVAAAGALVLTGVAVTDTAGVRPNLAREVEMATGSGPGSGGAGSGPGGSSAAVADLPADALLGAADVARATPGRRWAEAATDDGSAGSGLKMPCQAERYADPRPTAALVRTFDPAPAPRAPAHAPAGARPGQRRHATAPPAGTVVQSAERSARTAAAERAYRTAVSWFATCRTTRAQLVTTRAVRGVGDEATLLVLHAFGDRAGSTVVAGVARTGSLTTVTTTDLPAGAAPPALEQAAALLADAVTGLCGLEGAGSCAGRPTLRPIAPLPAAPVPAMLAEVDLPAVPQVRRPWVGTDPRQARTNAAATSCDRTAFSAGRFHDAATRTFLVPGAHLPPQFGLTETVGRLSASQAAALVTRIRQALDSCPDRQMGTHVHRLADRHSHGAEVAVWHVSTEISDHAKVDFLMGVARAGGSVAQVGFVPAPSATLPPSAFVAVVERAQARLAAMPAGHR